MRMVYHLGLHCTDDDRLRRAIARNQALLANHGVAVPAPAAYRQAVRETVNETRGAAPSPERTAWLMEQFTGGAPADRAILSNENFLALIPRIFEHGVWYGLAAPRVQAFSNLVPGAETELFLAIRNPATLLPALDLRASDRDYATLTYGLDVAALRWSELVARIRDAAPGARIVVWCNEDTPLIWSRLMHEMTGLPPEAPLQGTEDLLEAIMSAEGVARLRRWLDVNPPKDEAQRQGVVSAFLERFALEDELVEEVHIPGWTEGTVAHLTAIYDEDVATVAAMDGVEFVAPA